MTTEQADIRRDPTAPARARRVVDRLGERLEPDVAGDLRLLVSEIVTNSVKYGGEGDLQLILHSQHPRHAYAEVVDQGSGFVPVERTRPMTEVGGWGLHLVEQLSQRWGVREGSTHVWFEIDREGGAQPWGGPPASSALSTASSVTARPT